MANTHQLSKTLLNEVLVFLESTPPQRLSRNLRRMFMSYLMVWKDGHTFDMDDLLYDLSNLLELLDAAEDARRDH